ncbi:hypothetical protein SAMN05443428_105159 [Caloramator quimbayensis]|uniref:Uncharacterized protein n=1 Tax=Caloramator quimbayensis TaxID=1147123 RepID=A0A1T4X280_9CLOT|nr:hypothetical protein SAMN05443428_105159 [Caloramator quimbayensis]
MVKLVNGNNGYIFLLTLRSIFDIMSIRNPEMFVEPVISTDR